VAASKGRHLIILLRSSSSSLLTPESFIPRLQSDRTRRAGHGPATGARREQPIRLAIFCGQVFFEYDPSSAASLLSSAGISARECVCVSVLQYAVLWCVWVAAPGPIQELSDNAQSSCELLRPGVLWLRSFFGCQSSFFGRHLDQALPPHDCDSVCLCEQQFPEMVGNDAREVDEGKWKEFGGKVGKGKWAAMVSYVCCNLYWTYTRLSFFQYFSTSFDFADPGS